MRRRPPRRRASTSVNTERWTVSYMDLVTVLLVVFIVLYAMSSVDQAKFQALRDSLAGALNGTESVLEGGEADVVVVSDDTSGEMARALGEARSLDELMGRIDRALRSEGLDSHVRYTTDQRGLTVRLVSSDTFFGSGEVSLSRDAERTLDIIGREVAGEGREVSVEGHADHLATTGTPYPTNWELSSARATQVVRHIIEGAGMEPGLISATGYGASRPVVEGSTPEDLATNRRVDVVVLSGETDAVRALIPEALEQIHGTPEVAEAGT